LRAISSAGVCHCSWFSTGFAVRFDSVGEFNFRRDVLFSQAAKVVDIPHQEEKIHLFCGIFLHSLNSPTLSVLLSVFSDGTRGLSSCSNIVLYGLLMRIEMYPLRVSPVFTRLYPS
jgi:hypothetical protein